jgi:hypothetical protein
MPFALGPIRSNGRVIILTIVIVLFDAGRIADLGGAVRQERLTKPPITQQSSPRRAATVPDEKCAPGSLALQRARGAPTVGFFWCSEPAQQSDRGVARHHCL